MLKIPEKYDTNTFPAKFKDISRLIHAWLLGVSAATRELWCKKSGFIRTRMGTDDIGNWPQ
jgi:hypothetical protein